MFFAASRLVHLAAIIAALMLMFHPATNAYIRATRRTRGERTAHRSGEHVRRKAWRTEPSLPPSPDFDSLQIKKTGWKVTTTTTTTTTIYKRKVSTLKNEFRR